MAQTTTTKTIVRHITSCDHVPQNIRDIITTLAQEVEGNTKPVYATKSNLSANEDDDRPKFGSRKEFFQRVWDRLHEPATAAPEPAEIGGTFKYDGSSQGFTFFPTNKVVRPSPRRAPSTHVVAPSDVGIWGGPDLIDDKNRRVKIRGSFDDLPTMKKLKTCEL